MAHTVPYQEGDLFAVPLEVGGYGIGLVARAKGDGPIVGYFFRGRFSELPAVDLLQGLMPQDVVLVKTFGDLGLVCGDWPVIGPLARWRREDWPMPIFGRREPLTGRALRVEYQDDDPNSRPRESEISEEEFASLPEDGLAGFEFVQRRLGRVLTEAS